MALVKPFMALVFMTSLLNFNVFNIPVNSATQPFTVSIASKVSSLSSCISLLYASGSPFIVVRIDTNAPYTRPVLPRTSSAISGFFFCGMMLLPVEYASSISTKWYSLQFHMIISSLKRLRCIIMVDSADNSSIT